MSNQWIPFDAFELVELKNWPKAVVKRFFEINPLGEIRYLDLKTNQYHYVRPVKVNGQEYFMTLLGYRRGAMVVVRFLIKDLLKRYFSI